jgi:hypothetical protein
MHEVFFYENIHVNQHEIMQVEQITHFQQVVMQNLTHE